MVIEKKNNHYRPDTGKGGQNGTPMARVEGLIWIGNWYQSIQGTGCRKGWYLGPVGPGYWDQ